MAEYKGRITIGAILAVAAVVVLAFELNYFVPTNAPHGSSTLSVSGSSLTSWFGTESPPAGCGNASTRGGFAGEGWRDDIQSSWTQEGGNACIYTYLQNTGNDSTSLPTNESIVVTSYTQPSVVYFQTECVAPPYPGSFGPNSNGWNCVALWNTANAPIASGPTEYYVTVKVYFSNSPVVILSGNNIYVEGSATTTATTSRGLGLACGGADFELLAPVQNGSIYLRVVTNQGSPMTNNGTVFVTHTAAPASGASGGEGHYCLRLNGNATGYMELAADDGLPTTGSYNLTLFAGYDQGAGYQATIPSFTVQPNTTTYVTIYVPSGEVSIVDIPQGGAPVTTTTTASSIGNEG